MREIPNYPGYFADENGNIWSSKYGNLRKLKIRTTPNGYGVCWLRQDNKTVAVVAHRIVASAFWGIIPRDLEVNHKDLNKMNNSISNLELLTHAENYKHAVENGAMKYGELHPMAKLSESDVALIKSMLANGLKQKTIAEQFCVSQSTISCISRGLKWAHVQPEHP